VRDKSQLFVFHRTYEMASVVEACAGDPKSFIEVDWDSSVVLKCLSEYSRISLLHFYIFAMISVEERHYLRQKDDLYEDCETMREELEAPFRAYNIPYLPYSKFVAQQGEKVPDHPFIAWLDVQHENFVLLWEKMTDEVFHLLFSNREFLLRFNRSLANFLESGEVIIPKEYLSDGGRIKRCSYFPVWARNAVYYRDQGRCVLCQRDLTGLLSSDRQLHYDHIVPLKLWGTNDPCNLQLLCDECNLRKAGTVAATAARYVPWWT
jgi:hypothetical protein